MALTFKATPKAEPAPEPVQSIAVQPEPTPAPPPAKAFMFKAAPKPPPPPVVAETILTALQKWVDHGGTLMLINKKTQDSYKVLAFDPETMWVTLETTHGGRIKPKVGQREVPQYDTLWR